MAVQDFAGILNGVMWTQVVLALIFIALRMYTRYFIINSIGWDDIVMVINLITFIGYVACISVGITYGIGRKYATVSPASYSKAIMWEAIGQGICIMGIAASKSSVALFLLRIVLLKWHKAILWFCIVSTTLMCTITTTLLFLQCRPAAFLWDHTIEGGVCWLDFTSVGLTMGAWSAAMDFVLAILPWHVVLGLNMKRKEKLTVAFGLSLGIFAGICSIIRTYELQTLSSVNEYVYDTVPMLLWSSTEVLMTIICACIPVLRPLYVRIAYGSRGDSSGGRSYPLNEYSKKGSAAFGGGSGKDSASKIYMGPGASVLQTTVKMGSENASEESILRADKKHGLPIQTVEEGVGGIKRTDEIRVTSSAV
ncbi:hypothetical protein BU26DRAFT_487386 [Trematosphaeria pertusa]|uniref:Rhodopsin domain-containing protein n=1 Tax=Trematosphaeria pertusa TaxID=390896 RepID=A0A6A6IAT4_9PLEO|nr:uncharacterized protein BU26DRAFT_487386 [Trematosphaeria pertusa]KAF2247694.1 hypothetical protein BU26DRAFT_487386 [Trematosphaeria pertusa]